MAKTTKADREKAQNWLKSLCKCLSKLDGHELASKLNFGSVCAKTHLCNVTIAQFAVQHGRDVAEVATAPNLPVSGKHTKPLRLQPML